MSQKKRRKFSSEQKARAVLRHIQDEVPVSQICDELDIHPNQFYEWKKHALSNLSKAFDKSDERKERGREREKQRLESRLSEKDNVIAELLSEHMTLKKNLGDD